MIKLPVFNKKKCSYLLNISVSVQVLGILFPKINEGINHKIVLGCAPIPLNCICNKPNLLVNALLCSDFSQYAVTFS